QPLRDGEPRRRADPRAGRGADLAPRSARRPRPEGTRPGEGGAVAGGALAPGAPHPRVRWQDGDFRLTQTRPSPHRFRDEENSGKRALLPGGAASYGKG